MTAKIKKIVKEVIEEAESEKRYRRKKRIYSLYNWTPALLIFFAPMIILIAWLIYHNVEIATLATINIDNLIFVMWVWGVVMFLMGVYCGERYDC